MSDERIQGFLMNPKKQKLMNKNTNLFYEKLDKKNGEFSKMFYNIFCVSMK